MATLGPLNSRRPSGVCSMDPHMSKASGGHLWYSTLVCAAWQNLTASTVLAKVSMHRPCTTTHTSSCSIQPLFPRLDSIKHLIGQIHCIHCIGKGQHAPPLHHNRLSLTLRAARYNTWLLIKLTPKGIGFSFLFFSFYFCSFPQSSNCFPVLAGLSVLLGRSSVAFM